MRTGTAPKSNGRKLRGRTAVGALSVLSLFLAACGDGDTDTAASATSEPSESVDKGSISIMYNIGPTGFFSDYYLTKEKGYYADAGVDVEIMQGKGSAPTIDAVATGNVDIGDAGCPNMMLAVSEGRPVMSVGMRLAKPGFGFFVDKDSDIKSITDLAGAEMVLAPGTPTAALAPFVFQQAGVDFKSVKQLGVQVAQQLSAYSQGQGDTIATYVAYADPIIQAARPSRHLMWSDVGFDMPEYCFVVNRDTFEQKRDAIAAFLEATYKGRAEAKENPEASVDAMLKSHPELPREVMIAQLEGSVDYDCTEGMSRVGEHDPESWEKGVKIMKDFVNLKPEVETTDLYTNELVEGMDTPSCD